MAYVSGGNELLNPLEIFKRLGITAGSVVADLGCGGAGHFVIPAAKLVGSQTNVYAVDILKSVLASVTSIGRMDGISNIKTVWADLETLGSTNIKAESLDFALLINVLFLTTNHDTVLQEANRLVKSGGKILVIDWTNANLNFGPAKEHRIDPEKIKDLAHNLGLRLTEEFEAGVHHFGLIFQKP